VASIAEIAREHTGLSREATLHLQRLVSGWGLLADFCFADLLLFAAADRGGPGGEGDPDGDSPFVVLGHIRPTTSQTLYRDDLIGDIIAATERPLVARALRHGEILEGEITMTAIHERVRVQCIPVRHDGQVVGIMTREAAPLVGRQPGELERTYVEIFHRLARMIANGDYPYGPDESDVEEPPRVGDGVILLDRSARVAFASPNAISALHRIGIHGNTEGMRLTDYGFDERIVRTAYKDQVPVTREVERGIDTTVVFRCLPLVERGDVSGAVLICRDISDLRRRDRLLLSKDATIREIHHRVKNNLQTIGSLLRLQGRRLESAEARSAIEESVRRIRSIALVHESLSRNAEEDFPFSDVLRPILRMAEESMVTPENPVYFRVDGDAGRLPSNVATPLAVVLNELLQNAVDHAFPDESELHGGHVKVALDRVGERLTLAIVDDGVGLPDDFDLGERAGLGLTIVRTLVETELGGTMSVRVNKPGTMRPGTVVELSVQLDAPWLSGDDEVLRRPTGQMPAIVIPPTDPT
jgi:two-component system, sensor histidine kinase PdtaS